jgi:uncharacterized OsmC-like protein
MEHEPGGLSDETIANASETQLAAFGSCLAVGIHAYAVIYGIPIRSLELELEADMDTTSVWRAGGLTPKAIGFETIRVVVHLEADVPRQTLDALIHHALLWSPVANTLHDRHASCGQRVLRTRYVPLDRLLLKTRLNQRTFRRIFRIR